MASLAHSKKLLLVLFITGVVLAVMGSGVQSSINISGDNIITIDGHGISHDQLADAQTQNPNVSKNELLNLLIDNKLLLLRAEELGLVQSDKVIRKAIVQRIVEQEVHKVLQAQPDETDLVSFYQAQQTRFTSPNQFQVKIARFNQDDNQCSQAKTVKRIWDESTTLSADWHHNIVNQPLESSLHSETLVYRQLGNQLAQQLSTLQTQEMSVPIYTNQGCILMLLVNKLEPQVPPYIEVKDQVLAEYRITLRRKALSDLLNRLRNDADIHIAPDLHEWLPSE